jgi:transcriptional regulator with XRE-family HTH domain
MIATNEMDIAAKFGKRIKQIRLNKKLSQGDVAKKLGIGASYISQVERGVQNVSLKGMEKLAKALGVSMKELI